MAQLRIPRGQAWPAPDETRWVARRQGVLNRRICFHLRRRGDHGRHLPEERPAAGRPRGQGLPRWSSTSVRHRRIPPLHRRTRIQQGSRSSAPWPPAPTKPDAPEEFVLATAKRCWQRWLRFAEACYSPRRTLIRGPESPRHRDPRVTSPLVKLRGVVACHDSQRRRPGGRHCW